MAGAGAEFFLTPSGENSAPASDKKRKLFVFHGPLRPCPLCESVGTRDGRSAAVARTVARADQIGDLARPCVRGAGNQLKRRSRENANRIACGITRFAGLGQHRRAERTRLASSLPPRPSLSLALSGQAFPVAVGWRVGAASGDHPSEPEGSPMQCRGVRYRCAAAKLTDAIVLLDWQVGRPITTEVPNDQRARYREEIHSTLSNESVAQCGRGFSVAQPVEAHCLTRRNVRLIRSPTGFLVFGIWASSGAGWPRASGANSRA